MSELPLGWVSVPLDAVSNLIRGVTYKKDESADHSEEGYLPVLRANNIQNGKLQFDDLVFVLEHNIKDIQKVKKGDIVVAMSSGSKRLVGKSGIAETDFNGGFGAFCGVLRPSQHLNSKYVGLYTLTKEYSDLVSSLSKGVNINNLKPDHFSEINIPVAPLNEQIRIADKLENVLAKVDAAQARLEKIPTLLKRFRQSALAAATSRGLTDGANWKSTTIDSLCESSFYGPRFSKTDYTIDGIPTIRTTDMTDDGKIVISDSTPRISVPDEKIEQFKVRKGDLLITRTGSIGVMAVFDDDYLALPSAYLIRFRFNHTVEVKFLYYFLTSPKGQELMGLGVTTVAQPNINAKTIRAIAIDLPSIEEQKEIVRRVESLFALADVVEKQYLAAKRRLDRLTQSLLAKAFRGELVPQDPNDEPAAELLKRIQAERNAQPPVKNKRAKSA